MASPTSRPPSGGSTRENLPIEVKFSRRVVEDADPYGRFALPYTFDHFLDFPTFDWYNKENSIGF
jgi:hypothetical protein